jgi:hypothetical protein
MADLLPATRALLMELLEGLEKDDDDLPELRVAEPGRSGSRYWLHGKKRRSFPGRRPFAQFDELRAARLIRRLRAERAAGTFYAFTSEAFQVRDRIRRAESPQPVRVRPSVPPPEFLAARSRLEILRHLAQSARDRLVALVQASSIETFQNEPGSGVVFIPINRHSWNPLPRDAVPLLGEARRATDIWLSAVRLVVVSAAVEHLPEVDEHADMLLQVVLRNADARGPPAGSLAEVTDAIGDTVAAQLALIEGLPGSVESPATLVVPDTNALLHDPAIEDWAVGDEPASIVICHQVTAELDAKKMSANRPVAEKATQLIRRFKEYARRGDTFEGVVLAGKRSLRELPFSPDISQMPDQLDVDHADDRILATALHLSALHLSSRVVLVTRDRNLQNKARFWRLPAVDVADL